jgi:hypothetical protein
MDPDMVLKVLKPDCLTLSFDRQDKTDNQAHPPRYTI